METLHTLENVILNQSLANEQRGSNQPQGFIMALTRATTIARLWMPR
jgi:hypothetical protein